MQATKNKLLVYLLFCAVAILWGIILHKVFFKQEEDSFGKDQHTVKTPIEAYNRYETLPDTFKLALNYRDPFLNQTVKKDEVSAGQQTTVSDAIIPAEPKPIVAWPEIKYNGRILNPRSKKAVSILSVNGTESMIEEGQSFGGVKLLKNKADSVLVRWNGLQKYIKQ